MMPSNLSFGVEIEFLIAALHPGMRDPHRGVAGLPPVLRITNKQLRGKMTKEVEAVVHKKVKDVIDGCFRGQPITSFVTAAEADPTPMEKYRFWGVGEEESVAENTDEYRYYSVEIKSPAEYATPDAFEALCLAIAAVTSRFRCLVNDSCGLHVHIGLGRERLSVEHIRRIAALSYAVEPLLFTLHDPKRVTNRHSLPLRLYSFLSGKYLDKGTNTKRNTEFRPPVPHESGTLYTACYQYIGETLRHGEPPLSTREDDDEEVYVDDFLETRRPGHFEPFYKNGTSRHTHTFSRDIFEEVDLRIALAEIELAATGANTAPTNPDDNSVESVRQTPRIKLPLYDEDYLLRVDKIFQRNGISVAHELVSEVLNKRPREVDTFEATAEIYARSVSCSVGELLWSQRERLATNFAGYRCDTLQSPRMTMRTIEVRFGSASIDAEWVTTWAKICVGLFRFALYASPSKFLDLLTKCEQAIQGEGDPYDVLDLLEELGLFAEAKIAEKRLVENMGRWNLQFV